MKDNINKKTKTQTIIQTIIQTFNSKYLESDIFRYIYHIFLSILLGLLSGMGAILFHFLLEKMRYFFDPKIFTEMFGVKPYFICVIPVIGGLIIAAITRIFKKFSAEGGVMGVIKSLILNNGIIPLKATLFHFIAPIITIGTGMPLGPEGPAARAGSGIGSFMAQVLRLNNKDMRMYTAAGAGAAISAIFNAPIAGVFFGLEVILLNDMKNQALSALIISSVVADFISRGFLGIQPIIVIPKFSERVDVDVAGDIPLFLILGVLCGLISLFYFFVKKMTGKIINDKLKIKNQFLKLIPVALLFGIVLIKYYSLFGLGYDTINSIFREAIPVDTVFILMCLKIVFVALFLNAGAYGGTFAPSLSIGVMLGYTFAIFMNTTFGVNLNPVICSLVGMGGVLSGINSVPLTSILLVFELTRDYRFILPLMLASIISYLVTLYYNKGTVYSNSLLKIGIDVSKRGEIDLLGKIYVHELMLSEYDTVDYRMPFRKLVDVLLTSALGSVIVLNDKKEIMGIITINDIRQALLSDELVDLLIAADLTRPVPYIVTHEKVSEALQKIEKHDIECTPVVKRSDKNKIAGVLTHQNITHAYHTLLEEWETDQFLVDYKKKEK
ncbi:MAG: chloride channel protein [bacterium]|nr:chloride channel protein [bacterium]